jgi:hypothetical protein
MFILESDAKVIQLVSTVAHMKNLDLIENLKNGHMELGHPQLEKSGN